MAVRYGWCFVYARIAWWFESMNSDTLFEIVAKQLLFVVCVSRDTAQWHALHNGHSSHSTQTHTHSQKTCDLPLIFMQILPSLTNLCYFRLYVVCPLTVDNAMKETALPLCFYWQYSFFIHIDKCEDLHISPIVAVRVCAMCVSALHSAWGLLHNEPFTYIGLLSASTLCVYIMCVVCSTVIFLCMFGCCCLLLEAHCSSTSNAKQWSLWIINEYALECVSVDMWPMNVNGLFSLFFAGIHFIFCFVVAFSIFCQDTTNKSIDCVGWGSNFSQ